VARTFQKTDISRTALLSNFSVAMVQPEFALNVGYMGRVMANFGLGQLYLVSTEEKPAYMKEALKFSSHGSEIILRMKQLNDFDQLRKSFRILVGTTAIRGKRKSNITRKTLSLENSFSTIVKSLDLSARGRAQRNPPRQICFVFGRDTTGLTNDELRKCDFSISILTGTKYNTLNISHAAAIIFFEFQKYLRHRRKQNLDDSDRSPTRKEKQRLAGLFEELALMSDFQEYKQTKLVETVTRLLDRGNPSLREVYLLMGLTSKAKTKIKLLSHQVR
jgi:tRNA/rRNA methyltransferase